MPAWNIDADTINVGTDWESVVLVEDGLSRRFLNIDDHDKNFFIVGPKGFGKTLFLKRKSARYREEKRGVEFYPRDQLCEKLGNLTPAVTLGKEEISQYENRKVWSTIWQLALMVVIARRFSLKLPDEILTAIGDADSLTDVFNCIMQVRSRLHQLSAHLDRHLAPGIGKLETPLAMFIDNVDTVFEGHVGEALRTASYHNRAASIETWTNGQLGLMDASLRLNQINKHVKVFATLRLEAYRRNVAASTLQMEAYSTILRYTPDQLRSIFLGNIQHVPKEDLAMPSDPDPIRAFSGVSSIQHPYASEDLFEFIYRHTFGRPREIVFMGRRIEQIPPKERGQSTVSTEIRLAARNLLGTYKAEVVPYFDEDVYRGVCDRLFSNILSRSELDRIAEELTKHGIIGGLDRLYDLGMLGYLDESEATGTGTQRFETVGEIASGRNPILPVSDYYFVHPILSADLHLKPGDYFFHQRNLVGYGKEFSRRFERIVDSWHVHFGAGRFGLGLVLPVLKGSTPLAVIQRRSGEWTRVENGSVVDVAVPEGVIQLRVFTEDGQPELRDFVQGERKESILVLSNDLELIRLVVHPATSMSTALGPRGLKWFAGVLPSILPSPTRDTLNIYPFENSDGAVRELEEICRRGFSTVFVVPVVADRICSSLAIHEGRIEVKAEKYADVCVRGMNPEVHSLFLDSRHVRIAESDYEQEYFRNRKLWLLNGIHMMAAIVGYARLQGLHIGREATKRQTAAILVESNQGRLEVLSRLQAMRLMLETGLDKVCVIERRNVPQVFDGLVAYGGNVIERMKRAPDELERLLNLDATDALSRKFEERLAPIRRFLDERKDEILEFSGKVEGVPTMEAMRDAVGEVESALLKLLLAGRG